jgi:hypothetical protein
MQRGAYEAAYLARPIITSNFGLLRQSFPQGNCIVDGTPESIANGVRNMCAHSERYGREAIELNREKRLTWKAVREQLLGLS